MIFCQPCFGVICACAEFFGEAVYFTERGRVLELRVISEKLMVYRMASNDVRERCGEEDERTGPSTEPLVTPYLSCDGGEDDLFTKVN